MSLFKDYKKSKQPGEDFLQWFLIRKMTFPQQMIFIFLLIILWLIAAPHLAFWVLFFESVFAITLISLVISFIHKKTKKRD